MCGIVGIWDFKERINPKILKKMTDTLSHRGPDDQGIFLHPKENIGFGHRRLAILDLTKAGHQPMEVEKNLIVYNGEIYNFKEIRKKLRKKYNFFSNSDTEVILRTYLERGINCLEKFRGMFAFAVWDERKKKLLLARDRMGVKPLYYYFDNDLLIFASEIKGIISHPKVRKELNLEALFLFFQFGYIPAPYSIFKNIWKLEPGHYLVLDKRKKIEKKKYWDISQFFLNQKGFKKSEKEVIKELETILEESFKLRMISDVEVGHFLSGGIDSSTVAAILVKKLGFKLKTFTIGFYEKKYNEAEFAKEIAGYLGTAHAEYYCTIKEAQGIIPKLPEIYDEPFGDYSSIPTYLLSRVARKSVKVSLSADGGDEAFCGYNRYWRTREVLELFGKYRKPVKLFLEIADIFGPSFYRAFYYLSPKKINLERFTNRFKKIVQINNELIPSYKLLRYDFWLKEEVVHLLLEENGGMGAETFYEELLRDKKLKELSDFSLMQLIDYRTYLPDDILVKVDRATMAVSLEGRDPFLDHKLVEYAASLPATLKYKNGVSKYILRQILYKYIPKRYLERPKQGFTPPLENWLRGDLRFLIDKYLDKNKIKKEGIFNWRVVENKKQRFLNQKINPANEIWLLITFEMWKERWYK